MSTKSPSLPVIAIDGGGTSTRVKVWDAHGHATARGEAGPSSLALGVRPAWRNIRLALTRALGSAESDFTGYSIGLAVAGSGSPEDVARFVQHDTLGKCMEIMTDGYASLIGALRGKPGIVVAVGTGSVANRLYADGTSAQCGGWGFPAGDEGSGAWLGRKAVQALARQMDGRTKIATSLFGRLSQELGADYPALQHWLLSADATSYASLAPLIVACAEDGDSFSGDLLNAATREIEHLVDALDKEEPSAELAVVGGLGPILAPRLTKRFQSRLVAAKGNALDGVFMVVTGKAPQAMPVPRG